MRHDELLSSGLETRRDLLEGEMFQVTRNLLEINKLDSLAKAQREIVMLLYSFSQIPPPPSLQGDRIDTPEAREQIEADYELFRSCIIRAQASYQRYIDDLLVTDMMQRFSFDPTLEWLSDPAAIIDVLCTTQVERVRFEARRALYLGTHFFEYEKYFGDEETMKQRALEIDLYLASILSRSSRSRNIRIYHKLSEPDKNGFQGALNPHVPLFEHKEYVRRPEENYTANSTYRISLPSPDGAVSADVIWKARVKDPWSATLKAIRKNEPIRTLRDSIGVALYLYPHEEGFFDALVDCLERMLPVLPQDHSIHPSRQKKEGSLPAERSASSSSNFLMEKMISMWQPRFLLAHRGLVERFLPFSNKVRQEQFWNSVDQEKSSSVQFEMQIGLLKDYIDQHHAFTDQNHSFYKVKQARGDSATGDATIMLELLNPTTIYGIDFRAPNIREALLSKQREKFGHHHAALEPKKKKQ